MNIKKLYENAVNKNCNICNKIITEKDVEIGNCIATITKAKNKNFVHKTCLIRR